MSQNESPPTLVMCGYTTARTAAAAMAASTAEPPACSACTPAWEASVCGEATMPRYASVAGRAASKMRLAPSRRQRQLHPDVRARIAVVVVDLPESVAAVEPHRGGQPLLAVEPQHPAAEGVGLGEHALHQPVGETLAPVLGAEPHALELGDAGLEAAHRGGADHAARRIDHHQHHARAAVVLALPVGHVVVEPVGVDVLPQEREVRGQLARDPRVIVGPRAPDLVVGRHLPLPGVRVEPALPEVLGLAQVLADPARQDEEEIAQPVDVLERPLADVLHSRELQHAALRAPADRARLVQEAADRPATGQDEALE